MHTQDKLTERHPVLDDPSYGISPDTSLEIGKILQETRFTFETGRGFFTKTDDSHELVLTLANANEGAPEVFQIELSADDAAVIESRKDVPSEEVEAAIKDLVKRVKARLQAEVRSVS